MNSLKESLITKAKELGFTLFGVTPADPLEGAEFYARWIAMGYAGEMEYLKRNLDKRRDVSHIVPGARSVICLGMEYYQSTSKSNQPLTGRFASYARGDDYHDIIKQRLLLLWEYIQSHVHDASGRVYVDTGPVLERELAQRAGIGWRGKNTCLINKKRGSHFFLSEIISTVDIPFDEPATDHCGNCTLCLDACPTQAFPEPYVLDASRCISYLTIEHKTKIPKDLRSKMGSWIYGCDICQDVCPWNKRAEISNEPSFASRDGFENPPLTEWILLTKEAFNKKFRNNPAKRPKRRGLLRNVAVALGNSNDDRAIYPLIHALTDQEPMVRSHAAWGLGQLGGKEALDALIDQKIAEFDSQVRDEIDEAIQNIQAINPLPYNQ